MPKEATKAIPATECFTHLPQNEGREPTPGSGSGELKLYRRSADTTQRQGLGPVMGNWPNRLVCDIPLRTTLMTVVYKGVLELFKKNEFITSKNIHAFLKADFFSTFILRILPN